MSNALNRRRFLKATARTGLSLASLGLLGISRAAAVEPIKRAGKPRRQLSLAAYSFRDTFNHKDPAKRITLFDFLDYCADHACAGAELTSYYFPEEFGDDFLLKLKRHTFLRGLVLLCYV